MRNKAKKRNQEELFKVRLQRLVDPQHELVALSHRIGWERFEDKFGLLFSPDTGRPAAPTRLLVGLHYLKYSFNLSDEEVVNGWVENPYWQYFCGGEFFENRFPIHPTTMTRWRDRVGADGSKELLLETLAVAVESKVLKLSHFQELTADTTVQEKNITFPTDAKLLNRARVNLVIKAKKEGVILRQSYTRLGRNALVMYHRYMAAKHFKRARRQLRKLRIYLGRVIRDIGRKIAENAVLIESFESLLTISTTVLSEQKQKRGRTVFSIHAPEVECIGKGKAHKPYEFGVKVSVVTTNKSCFVVACDTCQGRPHDAATLKSALEQVEENLGRRIKAGTVAVDLGYRGHKCSEFWNVLHPRRKRLTKRQCHIVRRRSAIEAVISHMKIDCRMSRNFLKGTVGDRMNAMFAAAAYNLRLLIKAFVCLVAQITMFVHKFQYRFASPPTLASA